MNNFMRMYGSNWNEWKDVSKYPVDTHDFFKKIQAELDERKCKIAVITEMHGWPAIQDMYKKGQHGALTDALVLAHLCCGKQSSLRTRYGQWLALDRRILQKFGGGGQRKDAGPNLQHHYISCDCEGMTLVLT